MERRNPKVRPDQIMQTVRVAARSGEEGGVIDCPRCGGMISWGRAPNGHLHLRCSTPECMEVME